MTPIYYKLLQAFICCSFFVISLSVRTRPFPYDPDEDRNTTEIIRHKGYPCEEHEVVTDDGYILTVQRIPHVKNNKNIRDNQRPVVFLQHGLLDASSTWIVNLENESLGFILADQGYDVWLGNVRGNTYGLRHKVLSPKTDQFWDFSWDEISKYDLTAMIYYALEVTSQEQLYYIGHSQGSLIMFAQLSLNEKLASRIKLFLGLGPVATVGHMQSPIKYLAGPSPAVDRLWYTIFGKQDFLPNSAWIKWFAEKVCDLKVPSVFCENVIFVICGKSEYLNQTRMPVYITHAPAGTSVKNLLHYSQAVYTKKFQMFDFGSAENNIKHYNQTTPPLYDIRNIRVPVGLVWAQDDWLADPDDVQYLRNNLPNIVYDDFVPNWNHLDFVWATDARDVIYNDILKILKKY